MKPTRRAVPASCLLRLAVTVIATPAATAAQQTNQRRDLPINLTGGGNTFIEIALTPSPSDH